MTPKQQYLNVSANLLVMLGREPRTERESKIASDSYDAGYRAGRMQPGIQDSEIAQKLYSELARIHVLIDWQDDDEAKSRIGSLLELARGEHEPQ